MKFVGLRWDSAGLIELHIFQEGAEMIKCSQTFESMFARLFSLLNVQIRAFVVVSNDQRSTFAVTDTYVRG